MIETDLNYETEEGYLDVEKIIDETDQFAFITGTRSIGKTYGFLNYSIGRGLESVIDNYRLETIEDFEFMPAVVDADYQFFFLRRYLTAAKEASKTLILEDFYADFLKCVCDDILEKYDIYSEMMGSAEGVREIFITFRNKVEKKDKKRVRIGYISAVSAAEKIRGPGYPKVKIIILDEFQAKKNWDYIDNEPAELNDIYDSIARNRVGTGDCKVFCLGNAGTILNPYFDYYDYDEFDQIKTVKRNGAVIFYHLLNKARRNEAYNDLIKGSKYEKYASQNKFADNQAFNLLKLKDAKPPRRCLYNVEFNSTFYGVWRDGDNNLILSKLLDNDKRMIVDRVPIGSEVFDNKTYVILSDQLKHKFMYFDSPEIRLIAEKNLRQYIYKENSIFKKI